MLKQRVLTAVCLLVLLFPVLFFADPVWFCVLAGLFIVAAAWEWGRLNGLSARGAGVAALVLGVLLWLLAQSVGLATPVPRLWQVTGGLWGLLAVVLLRRGVAGWAQLPRAGRLGVGWALMAVAWWALAQARLQGVPFLLSVLALVWMADSAAYFGGRAFGRRKLAPQISPGKSWAGVYSGALGVGLMAVLWIAMDPAQSGLYARLWAIGPLWTVMALSCLTAMGVCGDLVESLVKRSAGFKDSSQLLPGHGGVLDRIDALLPVLPLAMMWLNF